MIDGGTIDYSQPIVVAQPTYAVNDPAAQASATDQAMQILNSARALFSQGDYQTALSQVDKAILTLPNDTVLHEFRGLTLFALKRYQEAAGGVYAVLSVGPGWDWTTLSSFYPNVEVYTEQLRALEQYTRQNPKSAEAHFLLAYHYLTCGHTDAAAKEFKEVVRSESKGSIVGAIICVAIHSGRRRNAENPRTGRSAETGQCRRPDGQLEVNASRWRHDPLGLNSGWKIHVEIQPKGQTARVQRRLFSGRQPFDTQTGK